MTESDDPTEPVTEPPSDAPNEDDSSQEPSAAAAAGVPIDAETGQPIDELIDDSLTDDDFEAFVADDRPGGFEEALGQPGRMPPPPQPAPPPGPRRLVRDPYAKLGGVSSGIAHYFGFDVALVRIIILLGSFFTGIGFFVYLLAWMIIPRAKVWPPVAPDGRTPSLGRSSISGRDLGLGLAIIGLLMMFGVSSGFGQFAVPLLLVGGGVWLLRQPAAPVVAGAVGVQDAPASASFSGAGYSAASSAGSYPPPPPVSQPVPERSGLRRLARGLVVVPLVAVPVLVIVAGSLFFVFKDDDRGFGPGNGFNFDAGEVLERPLSVSQLQPLYDIDAGEINLDLTGLDDSMFTDPVSVDVRADVGSIQVLVPSDLAVSVEARGGLGEVRVFDEYNEGIRSDLQFADDDAKVIIDAQVDIGEVSIQRANG